MRPTSDKVNLRWSRSMATSTINACFCFHRAHHCSPPSALRSVAPTFRFTQIPIAKCAALSAHHHRRVRSLAAFGRRPRCKPHPMEPSPETHHTTDAERSEPKQLILVRLSQPKSQGVDRVPYGEPLKSTAKTAKIDVRGGVLSRTY